MLEIDASLGEGGGQIVRTALALAVCTGTAVSLHNIRARRSNPGLRAQHLAAVHAAAAICAARVEGAALASPLLRFEPGQVRPGRYEIDVGTAGSTMLVLQTIFLPLAQCDRPSEILLRGGTHNPLAPTFEFVRDAWLPLLARLGFGARVELLRHGFFPRGGGLVRALIEPRRAAAPLELMERGAVRARTARILLCGLPEHVARREAAVLRERLDIAPEACVTETVTADGRGNAVHVHLDCEHVSAVFAGFGKPGVPAERVAGDLALAVERYLAADVAVELHLADQLLLPLALAAGGRFSTEPPSSHTQTNAQVIARFLPLDYEASELGPARWRIALRSRSAPGPRLTD
jgi:RNA 3'-terminal phosphate cyclase (ATP)